MILFAATATAPTRNIAREIAGITIAAMSLLDNGASLPMVREDIRTMAVGNIEIIFAVLLNVGNIMHKEANQK